MSSETMHRIVEPIGTSVQSRPSPIEFEMAYQVRVAIDKIRLVIKRLSNLDHIPTRFGRQASNCWRPCSGSKWSIDGFRCGHEPVPGRSARARIEPQNPLTDKQRRSSHEPATCI